jgi:hypothetical protein
MDPDPVRPEEAQRIEDKTQAGATLFIGEDLQICHVRVIVDCQMHVFPANAAAVALAFAIARDAVC